MGNRRNLNVQHVSEYEDLLNIHTQNTMRISFFSVIIRPLTSFNWCSLSTKKFEMYKLRKDDVLSDIWHFAHF